MKAITALAILSLAALAGAAAADGVGFSAGVRVDTGHAHEVRDRLRRHDHRREPVLFGSGPVNDFARDARRRAAEQRRRPRRRFPYEVDVVVPFDYYLYRDERRRFTEPGSVVPEVEHVPDPNVAAPEPPDLSGPRWESARRLDRGPGYAVGRPLPGGIPYVTLDWQDYDLPAPGRGELYVRFTGDVLLIRGIDRTVIEVIWPPAD